MFDKDGNQESGALSAASDKVGYANPPKEKQFKPGQSGNPNGRPRGSRNKRPSHEQSVYDIVKRVANTEIPVNVGGQASTMTLIEAAIQTTATAAAKNNRRAADTLFKLVDNAQRIDDANLERARTRKEAVLRLAIEHKVKCERLADKCRVDGLPPPVFFPNPDHILIDYETGAVGQTGPWMKDEVSDWEDRWELARKCEERIEEENVKLERARDERKRKKIYRSIERLEASKARALVLWKISS